MSERGDNEAISSEWRLLDLMTRELATESDQAEFDSLVKSGRLRWGEILEQAIRHKVISLLAHYVATRHLSGSIDGLVNEHLRETLRVSRYRTATYRRVATTVVKALAERGVVCAGTKGISLESSIYDGNGERFLGDIDFMIKPEDGEAVTSVMKGLGYQNGYLDRSSGEIKAYTRRDFIARRLNPDHLPPFVRIVDDPILPHIHVDFACSFTWTHCQYQIPVEAALSEVDHQAIPGESEVKLPVLRVPYQFIFTILHLFREAWVLDWLDLGQDVNLMKFSDVIRLWRRHRDILDTEAFRTLVHQLAIAEPLAWVLIHLDRTFGMETAKALGLESLVEQSYLNGAGKRAGREMSWRGTMLERLQALDRQVLFKEAG